MCTHTFPMEKYKRQALDTQMISSASFNTCCAPALIKLQKIGCRTDRETKMSLFRVIGEKDFFYLQPCPL